jgi:hypothetical protein
MTTDIKATKKKLELIKRIYEHIEQNDVKNARDLRTEMKCDSRLIGFLFKNNLIKKENGKLVIGRNSTPSIALARTYQSYIEVENAKSRSMKKGRNTEKGIAPTRRTFSILWGLFKISW